MALTTETRLEEKALEFPQRWKEPRTVIVEGDLFCNCVPLTWILRIFKAMAKAQQHRYLVPTRNSTRLLQLSPRLPWLPCIWVGVIVREEKEAYRIDLLRQCGAHSKYVCFEPLLRPVRGHLSQAGQGSD